MLRCPECTLAGKSRKEKRISKCRLTAAKARATIPSTDIVLPFEEMRVVCPYQSSKVRLLVSASRDRHRPWDLCSTSPLWRPKLPTYHLARKGDAMEVTPSCHRLLAVLFAVAGGHRRCFPVDPDPRCRHSARCLLSDPLSLPLPKCRPLVVVSTFLT